MKPELLRHAMRNVPRYTSYPTAPQFTPAVDGAVYADWLGGLDPAATVSLYLHVPFCRTICHYCGCTTRASRRDEPIAAYAATLSREIALVAGHAGAGREVRHLHWGGGTPSILAETDFLRLVDDIARWFAVAEGAEHAIEIDPRTVTAALAATLGRAGITRVSLGVQDFNPAVQIAIGRWQPFEDVARACALLREAGHEQISFDLMYGLAMQTVEDVERTVERAVALAPRRIAAFGYAHVPWMKKNQRRIDAASLPGPATRLAQARAIDRQLCAAGYRRVGLDHYARPEDPLARAAAGGALRRNFQGYTTDPADCLLGFGASAIGKLAQGYVQNAPDIGGWRRAIAAAALPVVRGLALGGEDRVRGAIIERLMCDFAVDLEPICRRHGWPRAALGAWSETLEPLRADGLVEIDGPVITVSPEGREFVRLVAAAFDEYLAPGKARHARAV
jgi:oxygen-independent coproporphyrinogen-3 oxidase